MLDQNALKFFLKAEISQVSIFFNRRRLCFTVTRTIRYAEEAKEDSRFKFIFDMT